ncbi:GntR family transcriptional regulator [Chitinimonas lacunae]|uniref:GntR family transcriptional regulator n=1 Tax=Chitinimonas lacunae TaxID=1963018 RepID=A0ABV8MMZ6_9NEIS
MASVHSQRTGEELPSRQPLYVQVRDQIVTSIEAGEWHAGDMLPSEFELADRFRVSQGTVRKGLDLLEAEGVLRRRQGLGTFVAEADDGWGRAELPGIGHPLDADLELLSCSRGHAGDTAAAALGLRRGAAITVVRRLARVAGEPFALIDSCVSSERFDGLDARRIKQADCNLRRIWLRQFGLRVVSDSPLYRAGLAGREEARLLGVGLDAPLLEVLRTASGMDGRPVEWTTVWCRTDLYGYRP